ncbi:transglycosylase domain-containing protein, partial [Desulfobacterales bacterium HSG16]|nr:transglycosylase domain-containing protein [Desulfobacterales bacterium HSG16]
AVLFFCIIIGAVAQTKFCSYEPSRILTDRHGRYLAHLRAKEDAGYGYWPVNQIPERVAAATLAIEDHRFYSHPGIDPVAVLRAVWQNLSSSRRISGASTLAMQVARMQNPGRRTYFRKSVEAVTAVFLTLRFGRKEVLKQYLALVPYGNDIHGIACAARFYLDRPVADLSWAQIAFLSAIPQAPSKMNPYKIKGRWRARARGNRILSAIYKKGLITDAEYSLARNQLAVLKVSEPKKRPETAIHAILNMKNMPPDGKNSKGKYLTRTSIDLDLQEKISLMAHTMIERWEKKGADNLAIIITDRKNREILAWIGSRGYFSTQAGAIDFCKIPRSSGSTLKPFIYAYCLDNDILTPAAIVDDLPLATSAVQNADNAFSGPLLPRQALANSRNVPAVNLVQKAGLNQTWFFFRDVGLHASNFPARNLGLGIAIGALPVTLERLVRAYGALADDGILRDLKWYPDTRSKSGQQKISKGVSRQIALFLSDPLARLPAFPRMGTTEFPFPAGIKTGTSQGYRDAWAVGWSNRYMTGVWCGRADNRPTDRLSGAGSAARLVQKILMHLHKDQASGMDDLNFAPPEGYQRVDICAYSGKKAGAYCRRTFGEYFTPSEIPLPDDTCSMAAVDRRNGLLATPWTPEEMKEYRTFVDLAPRYRQWQAAAGLRSKPVMLSQLDMPSEAARQSNQYPTGQYDLSGTKPVAIVIQSPANGARILNNPEAPPSMNSIALRAVTDPQVSQVLWYVDGKPFKLAAMPSPVRWPLKKGLHRFQARLPFRDEMSDTVKITVE